MRLYLDKYFTFLHHKANDISFAYSYLPSEYQGQFEQCIAKPREGRGSRGLIFNPSSWTSLDDKEFMIQEYHAGKEITVAFYVLKDGRLHGFITLDRELENGTTQKCHVFDDHNEEIEVLLRNLIKHTKIRGSANVQAILDNNGQIHIFEVNCRISGTNSIRHCFGFQDIKYVLQEYLYFEEPDLPKIKAGTAVRILMDVIYEDSSNTNFTINSKHRIY